MSAPRYQIIYSDDMDILSDLVCDAMKQGWAPQGGVSITVAVEPAYEGSNGWTESSESFICAQAMVRRQEAESV